MKIHSRRERFKEVPPQDKIKTEHALERLGHELIETSIVKSGLKHWAHIRYWEKI